MTTRSEIAKMRDIMERAPKCCCGSVAGYTFEDRKYCYDCQQELKTGTIPPVSKITGGMKRCASANPHPDKPYTQAVYEGDHFNR